MNVPLKVTGFGSILTLLAKYADYVKNDPGNSSHFCIPYLRRIIQSTIKTDIITIIMIKIVHHSPSVGGVIK
jgi:hypothetical protein